jgi:hypothetical protein
MKQRWAQLGLVTAVALLAGGCNVSYFVGGHTYPTYPRDGTDPIPETGTLAVHTPLIEAVYHPGEIVHIAWSLSESYAEVDAELYRYGRPFLTIATEIANDGSYEWTVPAEIDLNTEVHDEYQVVLTGRADDAKGLPTTTGLSDRFAIVPPSTGGLSDVTVWSTSVTITLVDNGAQIDGDTVDVLLNGVVVSEGLVLPGDPGADVVLELRSGPNVLEIVAVNEGSVSPNTAQLLISDVTEGESAQEWRLLTAEVGRLTITAPSGR